MRHEQQLGALKNEKATAQKELAEQKVMTGTLNDLQVKIAESEKQGGGMAQRAPDAPRRPG